MSSIQKKRTRLTKKEEEEKKHQERNEGVKEKEEKQQQARHIIRQWMQMGSVLDPLADKVLHANEPDQIISSICQLIVTVDKHEETRKFSLEDPSDLFLTLADSYKEQVGPVEREVIETLRQVPDLTMWPPGLIPMVVGFLAGDRSEREWTAVTRELDGTEWKSICDALCWSRLKRQPLHPLVIMGVLACGGVRDRFMVDSVIRHVQRHSGLIKALAILYGLVHQVTGKWQKGQSMVWLLVRQSDVVTGFGPMDTDLSVNLAVNLAALGIFNRIA